MPLPVNRTEPAAVSAAATEHMVAMRDGVRLATDVYLPFGAQGPFPTALVRLPYDKNSRYVFMEQIAHYLNERGYAVVVQDVRGKFRSEGETMPFVHEADDGYDTIEWITRQSWSTGRVGMFGDSYYGATQWAAVSSGHPALRAIAPRVTGADGIRLDTWGADGVLPLYGFLYYLSYWTDNGVYDFEADLSRRPLIAAMEEVVDSVGTRLRLWDGVIPEIEPLAAFPHGHPFDGTPLPVLHQAAWFDNILQPSINDWAELASRPDWAPLQYLHVDSTDHENYHLDDVPIRPELDHGSDDAALQRMLPRYLDPLVAFFDVFVKQAADEGTLPRASWHHGHLGYRTATSWPPPGSRTVRLHLADAARATEDAHGGGLLAERPPAESSVSWTHDPEDLVPSLVRDPFSAVLLGTDEAAVHDRPDVLTFTTAPLEEPLDLVGPVRATLTVGTDGPGAHVFLKLSDVAPDGSAWMLVRGQRAIDGGEPGQVTFDLTHMGYRIRAGHALRLHIAASDFPLYVPHPGTAENPWLAKDGTRTTQTLHIGGSHTSVLELTVIDAAQLLS